MEMGGQAPYGVDKTWVSARKLCCGGGGQISHLVGKERTQGTDFSVWHRIEKRGNSWVKEHGELVVKGLTQFHPPQRGPERLHPGGR